MIVIFGATSFKTRVLTYGIAYLMSKGLDYFNILALTFTNKVAKEMKGRIIKIFGNLPPNKIRFKKPHNLNFRKKWQKRKNL